MGRVVLVQHCQSEHHINDMSGGWTDTPLTELGRKQAQLIAQKLIHSMNGDEYVLYSSDLLRASQTAEILGKNLGLESKTVGLGKSTLVWRLGKRKIGRGQIEIPEQTMALI
ncbi:histidine phosphatase family protein [Alicyclobacillus fastidiosus]|uniref:Histidine phosphatase family protein n=1 Tax=Alicyclobacillus fastidiosus TaxID=392011 RepID=A0ABY6ZN80_9BACL|nr:phosphoglycerate mutase family protein [Alicyclobacillus fastidiosus]WAH44423.1 histidine phosphatase family protein [Alicyclobacillus fastidiosus]GMA60764.1 hypothetical protein GCM10025859_12040 [Alicyclobacillus fastidiosus]